MSASGAVTKLRDVRLMLGAGAAKPGPAIGQALGPLGVNMMEFCKQFNEKTKHMDKDVPIPVKLTAFSNKTFTFVTKTPATSWFVKKCAGLEKAGSRPKHEIVGQIHVKHVYEIAKIKQTDEHMKRLSLDTIARMIAASTKTMGIRVVDDNSEKIEFTAVSKAPSGAKAKAPAAGGKAAAAPAGKAAPAGAAAAGDKGKTPAAATPAADAKAAPADKKSKTK